MSADLLKKADQTPKNLEMYMLIEHNAGQLEKHQSQLDENVHTKVLLTVAEKKIVDDLRALGDIDDPEEYEGGELYFPHLKKEIRKVCSIHILKTWIILGTDF